MNDNFEQRLRRQPLRTIPPEWRADILHAARAADHPAPTHRPQPIPAFSFQFSFRWGALAAVWLVIFALNYAARDTAPVVTAKSAPPSPQMLLALRQQQKLLAELIDPPAPSDADKPKPISPRPRSELRLQFLTT
ncbi:MAG: hypothetical protein NTZ16_04975 [Verrucomicrobia bacterium]|nr:hypothetical protein [Verrucomicrobiota bacterium]